MRSLRTIVVLFLALAALVPLGRSGVAAGARMQAEMTRVGSARPVAAQSGVAQADKPNADTVPCRHTRKNQTCDHHSHLPCCNASTVFGLQTGPEWVHLRDARRIGPAYRASDLCPSSAQLSGIERPPKQG